MPDCQIKHGVDVRHIDWAAKAIVEYRPDVIINLGDFWDLSSLSSYSSVKEAEGQRLMSDVDAGNEAMERLTLPALKKRRFHKRWRPEWHYLRGNHEQRLERFINDNPKLEGIVGYDMLYTRPFQVHDFLEIVDIDGISYSHYFANTHSGRPIGGSIDSRLNKIGRSFVQGHEQGLLYGIRQFPGALTRHGLVAGSFYLHHEKYRGHQGNNEWRGIICLNEVHDGMFDVMPLSMNYLSRKFS